MKTATVRDMKHHFGRIESWLRRGERIRISKRGKPLMDLHPVSAKGQMEASKVDFAALWRDIWGRRVLTRAQAQAMHDLADGEDS